MLSELDQAIVRKLQGDLPLAPHPFAVLAEELGITEEQLILRAKEMQDTGIIRRFGAALRHREAGFTANAMVVWQVPEDETQRIGEIMATFPEVSHCYQRPSYPDWPYNMFTMVHGKNPQECEATAARISQAVGLADYRLLYSTAELKKDSMKYFVQASR